MIKFLSLIAITLPLAFMTTGCTQEPPPQDQPRYIDHLQFNPRYFNTPRTGANETPCLDGYGNCIMILPSKTPISQELKASYEHFKSCYYNDDLRGYFDTDPYWNQLFHDLQFSTDTLQKIIDGSFGTYLPPGDSTIIFYNGPAPEPANLVRTYWLSQNSQKPTPRVGYR